MSDPTYKVSLMSGRPCSDSRCQMGEVSDRSIVGVRSDMQGQINVRSAM